MSVLQRSSSASLSGLHSIVSHCGEAHFLNPVWLCIKLCWELSGCFPIKYIQTNCVDPVSCPQPLTSLLSPLCRQSVYSSKEIEFANSWANSGEYVAAAHFQSNMANSVPFITPLPSRILQACPRNTRPVQLTHNLWILKVTSVTCPFMQEADSYPIADLSAEENHTLKTFGWMKSINDILCKSQHARRPHKGNFCIAAVSLTLVSFLSCSGFHGEHVEECHVLGGHEGEGPWNAQPAHAEPPLRHNNFPVSHQGNAQ